MNAVQIIRSPSGEELVVLPRSEYEALLAAAAGVDEDAEDQALYDDRKSALAAGQDNPLRGPSLAEMLLAMPQGDVEFERLKVKPWDVRF